MIEFTILTSNKWLSAFQSAINSIETHQHRLRFVEGAGSFYGFFVEKVTSIKNLREELYNLEELI